MEQKAENPPFNSTLSCSSSLILGLHMNYAETLDYLFAQLPMFSRIGAAAYKADLDNTIALCEALDHPERGFKSIHIAGTNGKGSSSHMLASILQEAGYKTGLYTSPHLQDFRERIRINGQMISEQFVIDFTERMRDITERIAPSFFELTVAMAFTWFREEQVDIAVIETGLGGRLDSTNVIHPELSIITNIGFDHMNLLGNSLQAIANEKAGVIKSNTPVVIGQFQPETLPIFEAKAQQEQAPFYLATNHYQLLSSELRGNQRAIELLRVSQGKPLEYLLDLPGVYQQHNVITVRTAIDRLVERGWNIPEQAIRQGLQRVKSNTGFAGRWDILRTQPTVIADVAHNEDGIRALVQQVETESTTGQLHIVLGMVADKAINNVLQLLPTRASYYFTRASIPRALPEDELQAQAHQLGKTGSTYANVNLAVDAALEVASIDDLIIICGSVFLVGELDRKRFVFPDA